MNTARIIALGVALGCVLGGCALSAQSPARRSIGLNAVVPADESKPEWLRRYVAVDPAGADFIMFPGTGDEGLPLKLTRELSNGWRDAIRF